MMEKWVETKKDIEWKGRCSWYYWSVGSGARKPMGFLGPAHDELWSAGWHIIFVNKGLDGKMKGEGAYKVYSKLLDLLQLLVRGIKFQVFRY